MKLKNFYQDFGHGFPLTVVKTAYGYFQQGHPVESIFKTASILYAAKLEEQSLNYSGYACERRISKIIVYRVQTNSATGLKQILPYSFKENPAFAVTLLGENASCDEIASFENRADSVLGSYNHRNRYVAIVRLNHGNPQLTADMQESLKDLADVFAKNALAWWPAYQTALEKVEYCKKHKKPFDTLPEWKEFLLQQELRFAKKVNEGFETGSCLFTKTWITIGNYLRNLKEQTGLTITIDSIDIYGF